MEFPLSSDQRNVPEALSDLIRRESLSGSLASTGNLFNVFPRPARQE